MIRPDRVGYTPFPFTNVETGNTIYTTAHTFIFEGADAVGTPLEINIIGGVIDSGALQSIRVYDVSNSAVICELTDVTAIFPTILSMGTLTNIPTMLSIWEIQQLSKKIQGPSGNVKVSSAYMVF